MLTRKQLDLLTFIDRKIKEDGVAPSYEEMRGAVGHKSKSAVHHLILRLEERGYIKRLRYRARAIEVIRVPTAASVVADGEVQRFTPRIVDSPQRGRPSNNDAKSVPVPMYGRVGAGTPVEALRDSPRSFAMPVSLDGAGEHYALEVEGDSMAGAGIADGDIALVRRTDAAENGDIVVAIVDDREVALRRFRRRGASIALEPASAGHEIRIFGPDQVRIQGRLVALVRRF